MHKFKIKAYLVFTMLMGVFLLAGCNQSSSNDDTIDTSNAAGAELTAIAVTPADPNLPSGVNIQLTAMGTYTDGTSSDISASVNWLSVDPVVATVNASGLATGVSSGSSEITASLAAYSATTNLNITQATLKALAITPVNTSFAPGVTTQFVATGTYSDGTSLDVTPSVSWSSADTEVATVDENGLATGIATGSSIITASLGTDETTSALTITDATLTSIMLSPSDPSIPKDNAKQFTATGNYSDGSSTTISSSVTWSSEDSAVATVDASGLASGIAAGSSVITATLGEQSATTTLTVKDITLATITVTPASPTIAKGLNKQLVATGSYSDGSVANITGAVTWSAESTQVATVDTSGLANSVDAGTSLISATLGTQSGSTTLTVTNATLSSIVVSPANPNVVSGMDKQFAATATYSDESVDDISTAVTWSSSDTLIATVDDNGLVNTIDAGTAVITATSGIQSDNTTLTVTDATLSIIDITPNNPTTSTGLTEQFTATGTYSDGSSTNITSIVTWLSADTQVATMNANGQKSSGLAKGVDEGTSLISATLNGASANTTLTVEAALVNNPLAPELGEVERFVILASQTITTTSGSAIVDGDLAIMDQARSYYAGFTAGANPGQFDELTNGLSYAGDDSSPPYVVPVPYASMVAFINQSRTDLGNAYNFLAADPNPHAATQACPTELGDLTMTRGVYKTASDVTIQAGTLTLDAQGDADSVFIFSIGGNLTTGAPGGDIVLINGAQAKNVYFRTAGKTIVGTGTSFSGNVFTWSEVNVLTGASVTGRLLAVTEQVTLDANAVTKAQ